MALQLNNLFMETYLELEKKGKSIALLMAHYGSYEWSVSINHHINFKGFATLKSKSYKTNKILLV